MAEKGSQSQVFWQHREYHSWESTEENDTTHGGSWGEGVHGDPRWRMDYNAVFAKCKLFHFCNINAVNVLPLIIIIICENGALTDQYNIPECLLVPIEYVKFLPTSAANRMRKYKTYIYIVLLTDQYTILECYVYQSNMFLPASAKECENIKYIFILLLISRCKLALYE